MKNIKKYLGFETVDHRKKGVLTYIYVLTIATAFVVSLTGNKEVNAGVSAYDKFNYPIIDRQLEESLKASTKYAINSVEGVEFLIDIITNPTKKVETSVKIGKGDTFINVLTNMGVEYNTAHGFYKQFQDIYDTRKLNIGQTVTITTTVDKLKNNTLSIDKIVIDQSIDTHHTLSRTEKGNYITKTIKDIFEKSSDSAKGEINGNLTTAMDNAGVPKNTIADFINIFSFSVDFRRDLRKGDKFEIIYEKELNDKGQTVRTGDILYAALTLRKDKIALYKYQDKNGKTDYYTEQGLPMKKTLSRKPLAFQNARISSPFGKRRHPIFHDLRIHWGVDYAAPHGTPIYAGGDGIVQTAKYNGGYGKYIKIRHNSEYSTAYGHISRYAKGIKSGTRVKQGQVIAYVGNTGNSTGPHLHYEVIRNGKRVNPTTIKASTGENLKQAELSKFKTVVASLQTGNPQIFGNKTTELAQK